VQISKKILLHSLPLLFTHLEPSLTAVAQPAYLIGMKALEVMLDILDEKIPIIIENRIVVDSALKVRKSTRLPIN